MNESNELNKKDYIKLNYQAGLNESIGDFDLIFAPNLKDLKYLFALYSEFKTAIAGEVAYPMEESDKLLFSKYKIYYIKIAELLNIREVDKLDIIDRHKFFICTEPIVRKIKGKEERVLGLSNLERLLGYDYPDEQNIELIKNNHNKNEIPSTGNVILDVMAASLLTFKIPNLENHYSLKELSLMIAQAANLQKLAEKGEELEDGDENIEIEEEHPELIKYKNPITDWFNYNHIPLPLDW
jgi:hypothetical protein